MSDEASTTGTTDGGVNDLADEFVNLASRLCDYTSSLLAALARSEFYEDLTDESREMIVGRIETVADTFVKRATMYQGIVAGVRRWAGANHDDDPCWPDVYVGEIMDEKYAERVEGGARFAKVAYAVASKARELRENGVSDPAIMARELGKLHNEMMEEGTCQEKDSTSL